MDKARGAVVQAKSAVTDMLESFAAARPAAEAAANAEVGKRTSSFRG